MYIQKIYCFFEFLKISIIFLLNIILYIKLYIFWLHLRYGQLHFRFYVVL